MNILIFFFPVNEMKNDLVIHQKNPAKYYQWVKEAQAVQIPFFRVSFARCSHQDNLMVSS